MKALFVAPVVLLAIVGCSSESKEAPAEAMPKPAESTSMDGAKTPAATQAALAKCDMCGAEVASTELTDLHGQMACPACAAAHTH